MDKALWWIGAIHAAAYILIGSLVAVTWTVWKLHKYAKFNGRIVQWHYARARWQRRHADGLTEAEWKQGEPRP